MRSWRGGGQVTGIIPDFLMHLEAGGGIADYKPEGRRLHA